MGVVQKLGNFLGINKFAQGLATAGRVATGEVNQDISRQQQGIQQNSKLVYLANQEKDPVKKKKLLQMAMSSLTATPDQIDPGLNLTNKEILGSAANVALNVALPGAFKGGKLAVVGKNALLGAGFGAAAGMEDNKSIGGIAGSTAGGAIIGGALSGAGIVAGKLKRVLTAETPVWLMDKAIKPALQELKKNVKFGTKTLSEELLNDGVKGGRKKLLEIANNKLETFENQLQGILNDKKYNGINILRDNVSIYLKDLLTQKSGVPGLGGDVENIMGIISSIPEKLSLPEANQMKRAIYQELRDPAYKLDAKLSTKAATLKNIAKGLKTEIENAVGGTTIADINKKLSIYGQLENTITDQIARSMRNNGLSLTDAILAAGGLGAGLIGSTASGDNKVTPISFITALGLILARHNTTALGTYGAQLLKKGGEALSGKVSQTIKDQVLRRGVLNLK